MMEISLKPIGYVKNNIGHPDDAMRMMSGASVIELDTAYQPGLAWVEQSEFLDIIFYFHRSTEPAMRVRAMDGKEKGVFATRSPNRPNGIGVTTVKVIKREGRRLTVTGLDAVNGTPVLDIKPCDTSCQEAYCPEKVDHAIRRMEPRMSIWKQIVAGDWESLLLDAGQIHGHYCPGLAMGVMAAASALKEIRVNSDGLEGLLAIVETNNCLVDGVQWVAGCTIGNNALLFKDAGKTAVTLTKRDGKGLRFVSRHGAPAYIRESFPEFDRHYDRVVKQKSRNPDDVSAFQKAGIERAFGTLRLDIDRLFSIHRVKVDIPDYAPSHDSHECPVCGESVMATRTVQRDSKVLCLDCAGEKADCLDGYGIHLG